MFVYFLLYVCSSVFFVSLYLYAEEYVVINALLSFFMPFYGARRGKPIRPFFIRITNLIGINFREDLIS